MMATVSSTARLSTATSGKVDDCTVKIEPKRMSCVVPVAELCVVERYKNKAARPVAAPSTTPVAMSRPFTRCTPMASMAPAPTTPPPTKPTSGATPARKAPAPPAVATSVSA
jgi:hypothetical protein